MKILVVRFRQIGDAVLSSVICNSLRKTYPNAQIDFVLYENVSPLFENHQSISNVISITREEQKNPFKYFMKVLKVTRNNYDIIIDIMSTPKSELFTLLGRSAKYRIGRYKKKRGYTYTHSIKEPIDAKDKVDKFLRMLEPLEKEVEVKYDDQYTIGITKEEKEELKNRMLEAGLDFSKPIFAFAINSRRDYKIWNKEYMKALITEVLKEYNGQGIFYYSPDEMEYAKQMEKELGSPSIFTNVKTKSIREFAALISNCTMFIGNEGGPRHITQGVDTPSVAIFSPSAEKKEWLANRNPRHRGIEYKDVLTKEEIDSVPKDKNRYVTLYDSIKPSHVLKEVKELMQLIEDGE